MDKPKPAITEEEDKGKELKQRLADTEKALERTTRLLEKSQAYNEELRQQIEKLCAELHTYRSTAQNRREAECQVDEKQIAEAFGDKPFPDWGLPNESVQTTESTVENGVSIADSLKAAAQEVVWEQAGFVYDSASGLYYDYNSGYYYDSTRSLYYDPSSTAYYYYDETEQTYKFHSYAIGQHKEAPSHTGTQPATEIESSQNAAITTSKHTEKRLDCNREKSHKRRHKEKPKVKKGRIHRSRRRTKKSTKLQVQTQGDGVLEGASSKDSIVSGASENGGVVAEDLNQQGREEKGGCDRGEGEEEPMECESSESLATGESEMESEPESGELMDDSSSSSSSSSDDDSLDPCADPVHYDLSAWIEKESEISANYPPCIRVIIQSSDTVDVGTFFLVTCPGGTIGRDKDSRHAIQIPDINISKVHADIKYDTDNSCYTIEDLGSQNGTFLNDLRISESKEKSAAIPLSHGDLLRVGGSQMLLHIHPGTDTCDLCEPGQVLAALRAKQTVFNDHVVQSKQEKKKQAREQLKEIKKKYGLANCAYVDNTEAINHPDYADKAEMRRRFVGSEHPSHQKSHELPASVHRPLSSENKGHRMLAKMGWKEGSGLGKDNAGRAEPVVVELRAHQTAGLGSTSSVSISLDNVQSAARMRRLVQTQERYHRLEGSASSLPNASDSGRTCKDSTVHSARSESGRNGTPANSGDSLAQGGASDARSAKGPKKMEIKWIQGKTYKAT